MPGTIWQQPTVLEVNADTTLEYQVFTSTVNQTLYTLTDFNYAVGTKSLLLFRDGQVLVPGLDFTELSSTTFSLGTPATGGEQILAYGFVGITADVPVGGSGGGIQVVDNFTIVRTYPIDDPDLLLYAKGKYSDGDGYEGLFRLDMNFIYSDDDENHLVSQVWDGAGRIRLGAPATETIAGVVLLAADWDIPTLTASDKVIPVNKFNAAFNSILHGPLATGLSGIMVFDLDTLFYNIDSVVINSNANRPPDLPFGEEAFLTVKMGDSILDGVQTVIGNGDTMQGRVWRRFINNGVWDPFWVWMNPPVNGDYRYIPLDIPQVITPGDTTRDTWVTQYSGTLNVLTPRAAIIRIFVEGGNPTQTTTTVKVYVRKSGTADGIDLDTQVVIGSGQNDNGSTHAVGNAEVTVPLRATDGQFDWYSEAINGVSTLTTRITLVGYIT